MRILLVQETDWIDKGPFQQNHLMELLALRGHETRVIDHDVHWREQKDRNVLPRRKVFSAVSRLHAGATVDVVRPGVLKVPVMDYLSVFLRHRREIERQIREFRPDVVLAFYILSAFLSMRVSRRHNLPFVYYWIDIYHTQLSAAPFQRLARTLERLSLRGADAVAVICECMKEYVVRMGAASERTHVIPGTADISRFSPRPKDSQLASSLGITSDDTVVGFVGMFHKDLGLEEVVRGLASAGNGKLKLLLVGQGDWTAPDKVAELRRLAETENVGERVILTGKRPYDEVPGLMGLADILILPAYSRPMMQEIVPIKMYEYMAMERPVVSTSLHGVVREFGDDNGVVFVDTPGDVIPKAVDLIRSGRLQELGATARSFVERNNWDKITDDFETLLEQTVKEKLDGRLSRQV